MKVIRCNGKFISPHCDLSLLGEKDEDGDRCVVILGISWRVSEDGSYTGKGNEIKFTWRKSHLRLIRMVHGCYHCDRTIDLLYEKRIYLGYRLDPAKVPPRFLNVFFRHKYRAFTAKVKMNVDGVGIIRSKNTLAIRGTENHIMRVCSKWRLEESSLVDGVLRLSLGDDASN